MMNRPPKVLSAQKFYRPLSFLWEEYGWGVSVDYDDGKCVALYVGSLADSEIQVSKIMGDAAVVAHI
jgi:hypothetical protein